MIDLWANELAFCIQNAFACWLQESEISLTNIIIIAIIICPWALKTNILSLSPSLSRWLSENEI